MFFTTGQSKVRMWVRLADGQAAVKKFDVPFPDICVFYLFLN